MPKKRIAIVDKEKCSPGKCANLCAKLCPVNRTGTECIVIPKAEKARIDEELCTGCGICPKRCPFGAIHVINLPEELNQDPIQRFGQNGFHLYSLPSPMFGKVVGIVGRNGIGKSTAIKILAGISRPNFGKYEEQELNDAQYHQKLISFFKGTEAQLFFEKVKKKEITISYKPQQVDLLPKQFFGKVRDLLKKIDEKGIMEDIVKRLQLNDILDTELKNISGGELQRVAIAATVLKKANLYIFDEPTSFLDIKQRIRVSEFIKSLADNKTAVLVVEHDLVILDYMTDLVHLMYGLPGCYGIVSQPKTTRVAINRYLEGYLKEENIRFRPNTIKFEAKPPVEKKHKDALTSWQGISKKLDKFSLNAISGTVYKGQVAGILGENGIGKTTFMRILAGEIAPEKGELKEKIRISYKPQYIYIEQDSSVEELLKDSFGKYENLLMVPLDIPDLLAKKLSQLSGGELQRVAIALCLSRDADLYLLDEPSAYLDVEQRLIVSKIIRDFMELKGRTALIVDHDVLFVDYFADHLIVMEGVPAKHGTVKGPFSMAEGMNIFLKELDISMRRDLESKRPRINDHNSQMDRKQKQEGKLYYQ